MNILKQNQKQEGQQDTICKIHNLELIAVDIDLSDKSQIQFFCGKCLVEKINNNKVTTIEQSKERIIQMKAQQKEIKTKENQGRLNYYKNILDQIMDFKQSINDSLDKMYKQIQQYIFPIQKEKQELQDYDQQLNYFDDLKQLSQLYSQTEQKSQKLEEDNNFIDEMQRQFELLFNCSEYFQTLDSFKNTKETIKDIMENNIIELIPLQTIKNESKTPSLNRLCNIHKKEIIMIDIDSQNKKIEDRFACVDCISENSLIKYQSIENVNKQWKEYNEGSDKILKEYKKESKDKKQDLINQLTQMRKNYNKKLNEISDKLISEQFLQIDNKPKQSNQIKKISIQTLDDEQLIKDLKQLIEKEKEKVQLNQVLTNQKNKDSIFQKEIEFHLESLKQYHQQDISSSLDILKGITNEKNLILQLTEIIQQMQKSGQKDDNHKHQINLINEIQELIDQAKKCQLQLNLFDQSIGIYQYHVQKIQQILQNIELKSNDDKSNKSEQLKSQYLNLINILNEYQNQFENNNQQYKKICNIQQMENDLVKLEENKRNLEIEKNNQINSLQNQFDQKIIQINEMLELKQSEYQNVKEQFDKANQENINLKMQYEQDKKLMIEKSENEQNKLKHDFNQKINQQDQELKQALRKIDQINEDKLKQEKIQKIEVEKIQQYNKALTFSNTYKYSTCQVSEEGKFVAEVGNIYHCFCVCEQSIPKTGKIQFTFQILSGTSFFVGIGFRDIMQQKNYYDCYKARCGTYLISEDGKTWSHHNKDVHDKYLSFKFTNNDIIIIEVSIEDKYIKWSRQNNPQLTFVLDIDISQELYPCVGLGEQAKIKILN